MRVIYCDPSLYSNLGHYATYCRLLVQAFRQKGHDSIILSSYNIEDSIQNELGAYKVFSVSPYALTSNDTLCGWIKSYYDIASIICNDLLSVDNINIDDLVFFDAATPAALWGIILWMKNRANYCPKVVVSLIEQTGMLATPNEKSEWEIRPGNHYPSLYRLSGLNLPGSLKQNISFITVDRTFSEIYSFLVQTNVNYVPHPYNAICQRSEEFKNELTIGFIGAQRPNKGFHLVPEIVGKLLSQFSNINILVQDGRHELKETLDKLQQMSINHHRLRLVLNIQSTIDWKNLLSQCDILVAPYDIAHYATACSGISCEALANGIPLVAPEATTLTKLMHEFGFPGESFSSSTPDKIVEAIGRAILRYETLSALANNARKMWAQKNGALNTVVSILNTLNKNVQ